MRNTTVGELFDPDRVRTRLAARKEAPEPPPWHPPVLTDFYQAQRVLAWDASLSHCAWVLLEVLDRVIIHAKGCINPQTQRQGYLGTWDKALALEFEIRKIAMWHGDAKWAVEAPAVRGMRTESSLMAGYLVWSTDPADCAVISATHVSAVLLGDAKVRSAERKKRIREEVIRLIPEAAGRDWNEHMRDGASVGLTCLYDEAQRIEQRPYWLGAS